MPVQVQLRRGTTTEWSTANPTLAAGELGVDTTLTKFKVGNGSTAWNSLGYSTMTFQGAYSAGTVYYASDIVTYNGASYICILQSTGNLPTNTTYFSLLAANGTNGTNGTNGISFIWRGTYNSATAYVANDIISYNNSTYICILASTGNLPTNTTYWSLMAAAGIDGEVTLSTAQTLTNKTITSAKYVVSALGSISGTNTLDLAAATEFTATIGGATTLAFSNAPGAGSAQVVYLRLTNAGSAVITWPASTKFAGGTAPTLTASGVDLLAVKYDLTTTTYQVFVIGLDVK